MDREEQSMGETQTRATGSGYVNVALAVGLSGAFVILAVVLSPLVAAAAVVPAAIAVGRWRAHNVASRSPHSLSVPVYSAAAVVHAPRAAASPTARNVGSAA